MQSVGGGPIQNADPGDSAFGPHLLQVAVCLASDGFVKSLGRVEVALGVVVMFVVKPVAGMHGLDMAGIGKLARSREDGVGGALMHVEANQHMLKSAHRGTSLL